MLILAFVVACEPKPPTLASTPATQAAPSSAAPVLAKPPQSGTMSDSCEPSSIVAYKGDWLIGDNEDSSQLYVRTPAMEPKAGRKLPAEVEDIESVTTIGSELVVLGSYSRNKHGEVKPNRSRMLVIGGPTGDQLVRLDLTQCSECVAAQSLAPNDGGLNIEGAVAFGDHLALGLRSPLAGTRARMLMVPMTGPNLGKVDGEKTYDLGGEGFREIVPWKVGHLIVSGPVADGGDHHLWYLSALDLEPRKLGTLPPGTESILPMADGVLYLIDGDGKPGQCATPGVWGTSKVAMP